METILENRGQQFDVLERFAYGVIAALVFLLPFFAIPGSLVSLELSKATLFFVGVALAGVAWLLSVLRRGTLSVPRSFVAVAALLPAMAYLIATPFAETPMLALFGQDVFIDTAAFALAGGLLFVMITSLVRSHRNLFRLYLAFGAGVVILVVVEAAHLFWGLNTVSFGLLTTPVANLLGKWNDLGVLFGLTLLLSVVMLEGTVLSFGKKAFIYVGLLVSLLFLVLVQFTTVWYVLAVFTFLFFVFQVSTNRKKGEDDARPFPFVTGGILLISIIAILTSGTFGDAIAGVFNTSQVEVRPSWSATFGVVRDVLETSPLVGAGPGHFTEQWFLHKPEGINTTAFWAVPFRYGIGVIPTSFVTVGILGFAAWALLIGAVLSSGVRSLFFVTKNDHRRRIMFMSLVAALYTWTISVVYVPSTIIMVFAFFFSGLFVASAMRLGVITPRVLSFTSSPIQNFVMTLVAVTAIICIGVGGYVVGVRFASDAFYQRGILTSQAGATLQEVEEYFTRAAELSEQDRYYRALAEVETRMLSGVLSQPGVSADVLRGQFQTILGLAIANAQRATEVGAHNFENWLLFGGLYGELTALRIDGAYENARAAYERAKEKNPTGPNIPLSLARLEALRGDMNAARERIGEALSLKPNYTDAVFMLSQIEVAEGNIARAIESVETATLISPNDPVLFFQLGLLRYSDDDFNDAAGALENAVLLNPFYANAKYFLGLSYEKIGRREDAIVQFEDVARLNPDNEEVQFILSNLRAGRDPFADVAPPLDDEPEGREGLPVEEPVIDES